jgi:hypothetical protein
MVKLLIWGAGAIGGTVNFTWYLQSSSSPSALKSVSP